MSDTEVASVYLTLGLDTSEWLEELNKATDRINKQFVNINSEFTKQVSNMLSETVAQASKQFTNINSEFTKQMSNMSSNASSEFTKQMSNMGSNISNDVIKKSEKTNDSISKQMAVMSKNATKNVSGFINTINKKLATAFGTVATGAFIKSCIEVGSNVTEVQNVVDTAFKDLSWQADKWASNAMTNFGLSELSAKKYMGVFGQMSNAMGITGQAALDMAENVTGLTGDVASFYNLGTDEAYTKLKSIWTGETETLKDLGVIMTQTNLDQYALNNGFGKTTAKMTEQEKVMLRYQYVTSALSNATGDFVKTQDSWANQTRILSLRFEQLKASLGKGFIALFTPILRGFNSLLAGLQKVADGFANFVQLLTGADISASMGSISSDIAGIGADAGSAADNVSDIGSAAKKTAKDIEKSLAGFDQINKLTEPTDDSSDTSGSSGGTTSGIGSVDLVPDVSGSTSNATSAIEKFVSDVKNKLGELKEWGVATFSPSLSRIWDGFTQNTATAKDNLAKVFSDIRELGPPLLDYFNGPFTDYLVMWVDTAGDIVNGFYDSFNMVFSDIWDKAVYPILQNFVTTGLPMITDFATKVLSLSDVVFNTIKKCWDLLWSEGVSPAIELISNTWIDLVNTLSDAWDKWGAPIFTGIKVAVEATGDVFVDIWENMLKPVWQKALNVVDEVGTKHLQPLLANFLDFVGEIVTCATTIYSNFIAPVVSFLSTLLGPVFVAVFNTIVNKVGVAVGTIADLMSDTISVFKGIIQFIKGVFSGDWDDAWNGIVGAFDGIFSMIVDIAKRPINMVIGLINGMLDGLESGINSIVRKVNGLSFDVPDWVPIIGGDHFGFDLPQVSLGNVPYLAQGGYVKPNTPQLAMIGDNKHQGEVVAPEDKLIDMAQKAAAMASSAELLAEAISILKQILKILETLDLDIQLDGKSLKKYVVDKINEHTKQTGKCEIIT
jgi:phage-related protein